MSTIVRELSMTDLNEKFFDFIKEDNSADQATEYIYETLIEDAVMDVIFEFHHGLKTGLTDLIEGEREDEEPLRIIDSPLCDIFGFSISKKTLDTTCVCPNCERPVSGARFAPHLEKCMGMGRNSSRIASRRIASNTRETSYAGMLSDDDDDADWSGPSTSADRRKKKVKSQAPKKTSKSNNGANKMVTTAVCPDVTTLNDGGATYETMTANERRNLLLQICGVVSEHTKKICTRSTRCPQHTEDQKRNLRLTILEPSTPESSIAAEEPASPLDSSPSSSCSSSSRKRDRHRTNTSHKHRRDKYNASPNKD